VNSTAGVFGSDVVSWAQLGSSVSQTFFAYSTPDYDFVSGHLSSGAGKVVSACSTCAFKPTGGIAANDALLLVSDGANDSAPLTLTLSSPVYGAGAYIEGTTAAGMDANTTFTIRIQAFYGVSSVLTSTALVTSDSLGDPIFVGVTDTAAEITKVVFSLTDVNGNPQTGNFAIDKLYVQNSLQLIQPIQTVQLTQDLAPGPSAPEPSMTLLMGPALLALVFGIRKRVTRG